MAYTIYLRTNKVNGKQYVGQTGDFKHREECWKSFNKSNYANWYLEEERKKYGLDNFNVVIIDHCETQEEAYELEEKYIKELDTKYPNGYNMTDGGKGVKGYYVSEERRRKMREIAYDRFSDKQNHPMYGKHHSEEAKEKMRQMKIGRKLSEETKRKMSEANKGEKNHFYGKHHTEEARRKIIETRNKKPIMQYTKDGEFIREWASAYDAARELGFKNESNIKGCCKGKYGFKTAYGYIWKYADE